MARVVKMIGSLSAGVESALAKINFLPDLQSGSTKEAGGRVCSIALYHSLNVYDALFADSVSKIKMHIMKLNSVSLLISRYIL